MEQGYFMNKKIKSAVVGFLCMLFIDSLVRVILTVYQGIDYSSFSYVIYPGYLFYLMIGVSMFGAFFGGMMVITLSGSKWLPFLLYLGLVALWRFSPLLLVPSEPGWVVITTGLFSIGVVFLCRQFIAEKEKIREPVKPPERGEEIAD